MYWVCTVPSLLPKSSNKDSPTYHFHKHTYYLLTTQEDIIDPKQMVLTFHIGDLSGVHLTMQ